AIWSNGGLAPNTWTLPTSLSVIHTSSFSGLTAMLGQKELACDTRLIIRWDVVSITANSGVKLEQTKPYRPSGPNIVIPGPFAKCIRRICLIAFGSMTET